MIHIWHNWSKWSAPFKIVSVGGGAYWYQQRDCDGCGIVQRRSL